MLNKNNNVIKQEQDNSKPKNSRINIYIDTETGGLSPLEHDVLTFAVLAEKEDEQILKIQYNILGDPLRVTKESLEINNINLEEHNKKALTKQEVKTHFLTTMKILKQNSNNIRFIGQNPMFDVRMLEHNIFKEQSPFREYPISDTVIMSKKYCAHTNITLPNHKLQTLSEHFGYDTVFHDAMNDVLATKHVYNTIKRKMMRNE